MKQVYLYITIFSKFQPVEILKHSLQRECQNVVKIWPSWKFVIVWLKPYFLSMDGSGAWYASKTPSLRRWHMAIIRSVSSGSSDTGAARSSTYVAFSLSLLVYRKDLLCMPAHRVLCTYCLSCPFKAVADDTLMTSGQDPLTSGNQSSLLTFAVIHFHIITLFLPSEYVSPGFPLFSDHLFPQHAIMIKFDCHVKSNNGIWWFFLISNIHIQF